MKLHLEVSPNLVDPVADLPLPATPVACFRRRGRGYTPQHRGSACTGPGDTGLRIDVASDGLIPGLLISGPADYPAGGLTHKPGSHGHDSAPRSPHRRVSPVRWFQLPYTQLSR